jgi:Domain of unknown function (DUF4404)
MTEEKLRAAIREIHSELAHADGLNQDALRSLRRLAAELEALPQRPGSQSGAAPLREELRDWVRELEATHPTLSVAIGRVIDTLAFFNL